MGPILHCIGAVCIMLNLQQFKDEIIVPTLKEMDMYSPAAVNLLLGTVVQESNATNLLSDDGVAKGIYQIEPATHEDIWENYLIYAENAHISNIIANYVIDGGDDDLIWNLKYATIIARLVYWRRPEPLPDADDVDALAQYWKDHYNTHKGRGTAAQFGLNYRRYIQGIIK